MIEKIYAKYIKYRFEKGSCYHPYVRGITGYYDIFYHDDNDPMQMLDIYYPENQKHKKLPVIFNIHGGAWIAFDKNSNRAYSEYLATFGYCVVNLSYRLLPKTDIIGQLRDVAAAIDFIMKHDYAQIDKERVILMGDSAGGHLASMMYCLINQKKSQELLSISIEYVKIKAIVLQNAVSDFSDFSKSDKLLMKRLMRLLFAKAWPHSTICYKCSFLELAEKDLQEVPVFLVSSEQDPLFYQTRKLQKFFDEHNWKYSYKFWKNTDRKGLDHVFQVKHPHWDESKQTHDKMFDFLADVLKNEQ